MDSLLGSCRDFEEEESLLQAQGMSLGVTVNRAPKCHCELAREGIKYSLGCAKNYYWQQPIREKRKKENFRNTVRICISQQVLTIERVHKFSQRVWGYIIAYHMLHEQRQEQGQDKQTTGTTASYNIMPDKIESLIKDFKTHRCALDFDKGFIKATMLSL